MNHSRFDTGQPVGAGQRQIHAFMIVGEEFSVASERADTPVLCKHSMLGEMALQ